MGSPRTLVGAVRKAAAGAQDVDVVAVALAETYAKRIDADPGELAKLGPLLLAALEALRMTPRSRAAAAKGSASAPAAVSNPLDQLRARRRARTDGAAPVDPAAS